MTCGSVLKIANVDSSDRLHSHDVKYGSGSGQQVLYTYICTVYTEGGGEGGRGGGGEGGRGGGGGREEEREGGRED